MQPRSSRTSVNVGSTSATTQQQFAIRLSLTVGFLMLAGKMYAYIITNSAAILSDAAESVVHVMAVAFAAFSLWLSIQPADKSHTYGHDKISFFSAGVEGMLIVIAAIYIIYEATAKWIAGLHLENLYIGTLYVVTVAQGCGLNYICCFLLIPVSRAHTGRRRKSRLQ